MEQLQGMLERAANTRLVEPLTRFPAVALLGPRQVGKTTLALSLAGLGDASPLYLDLEFPSDRAKLADPELYLSEYEDQRPADRRILPDQEVAGTITNRRI